MTKKTRINKWRKYREEIDSNENIHFSIVNSDEELKKLFKSINFNIESSYKKNGFVSKSRKINKNNKMDEKLEIESIINQIDRNENVKSKNTLAKDFSSHKNDNLIREMFYEFIDKNDLNQKEDQETTDLKIKKININES